MDANKTPRPPRSVLPVPDPIELLRRLDPIRQALGADHVALCRRLPVATSDSVPFEVLAQCGSRGLVEPAESDLPFEFVSSLLQDGRPREWTRHAADPRRRRTLADGGRTWLGGWPLPSDRWPCIAVVAWCTRRRDPGAVRRRVAEAGMEALARGLVPPSWMPFAPLRKASTSVESRPPAADEPDDSSLASAMARVERKLILEALQAAEGNKTVAARSLQLSRQGLYRKLRRHGLITSRRSARQQAGS